MIYYDLHCLKVPHNKEKDAQKIVKEEKLSKRLEMAKAQIKTTNI